jgi:hypothetical protein
LQLDDYNPLVAARKRPKRGEQVSKSLNFKFGDSSPYTQVTEYTDDKTIETHHKQPNASIAGKKTNKSFDPFPKKNSFKKYLDSVTLFKEKIAKE